MKDMMAAEERAGHRAALAQFHKEQYVILSMQL